MKNFKISLVASAVALAISSHASAGLTLYDQDNTTFSTDGLINTFYVNSQVDDVDNALDRTQSRIKMGFLPNWIGFNFAKEVDGL